MSITTNNVVFVYRAGDSDSLEVARYYQSLHDLDDRQLISVPCSDTEILDNETEFNTQVLNPLDDALYGSASLLINDEYGSFLNIWVIVLGYNVPGGFYDDFDIISSTSRISRINYSYSKKVRNDLYDRKVFKRFDAEDAEKCLIVSRIDAPTVVEAKYIIDNSEKVIKQRFVNGKLFFDPYSDISGNGAQEYTQLMLDFFEKVFPSLNLDYFSTVYLDPYIDSVLPYALNDSFVWSWFSDRGSSDFFRDSVTSRIFHYNADYDGAFTVRNSLWRGWPRLALEAGYTNSAGAMSMPGIDAFLNPKSFFTNLYRGATIGEAFLISMPYFDWTIAFFGDPLIQIEFPVTLIVNDSEIEENEGYKRMSENLARSLAYYRFKEIKFEAIRDSIIDSTDIDASVDLLVPSSKLYLTCNESKRNQLFEKLVQRFFEYPEIRFEFSDLFSFSPSVNDYLSEKGYKLSELIPDSLKDQNIISSSNKIPEDYWKFESNIYDVAGFFSFYHFELQVSDQENFSSLLFTINSRNSQSNWYYEIDNNIFEAIPSLGVPSSFVGRRVRYISSVSEYLDRATIHYYRIRQISNGQEYNFRTSRDIIFS